MAERFATAAEADAYRAGMSDALALTGALADGELRAALVPQGRSAPMTLDRLAETLERLDHRRLVVLKPFDRREAVEVKQAADLAGVADSTLRSWADRYGIGRRVVGSLLVSLPALRMLLDDDAPALAAYLVGDRGSLVARYFERCASGPIPQVDPSHDAR